MSVFSRVSTLHPKRSAFDLSHGRKFSCDMGKLVPILCQDVVPGDKFKINSDCLVRLAPSLAPVMHRVDIFTHFFFVPNRLIMKDWESFITGGETGDDSTLSPVITLAPSDTTPGSLADYLGVPTFASGTSVPVSALPFRAYNLIYNEWYRDQNIQDKVDISLDSGDDSTTSTSLLSRNWEKDYFTSALPWAQKGPAVKLPLTGDAPVVSTGDPVCFASLNSPSGTSGLFGLRIARPVSGRLFRKRQLLERRNPSGRLS